MKKRKSSIASVIVLAVILAAALAGLLLFARSRSESRSASVSRDNSSYEETYAKAGRAASDKDPEVKKPGWIASLVSSEISGSQSTDAENTDPASEGSAPTAEPVETPEESPAETPTPEPTLTPEPTPAPEPSSVLDASGRLIPAEGEYLSDLETVLASTYVDESLLDTEHLQKYFRAYEISDPLFERIYGDDRSYKTYCTVPREDLRYIKLLYCDFEGQTRIGEIMINRLLADDILYIFEELYKARYPFNLIVLVDDFSADDDLSIAHNNTSAFNYRNITGGSTPSNHAYGTAIDINPYNNPYIYYNSDGNLSILDAGAEAFLDRDAEDAYERHMINYNDLCYQLFTECGWEWGGDWSNPVDYQHFEKPIYP